MVESTPVCSVVAPDAKYTKTFAVSEPQASELQKF